MKRLFTLVLFVSATFAFISCETETILSVDQTAISFPDAGGSSSVVLTANKPWTACSDQSWCKVSPSGAEEASGTKISISCDANPGYDARSCTVTISCEEKTVAVSVSQSQATGLFVTTSEYALSNEKHTLTVEVKANVEYEVTSEAQWIRYAGTKGLSTSQIVLEIDANESFDGREGKVSVKQKNGGLSGAITIKQDSSKGLFVSPTEYNLSNESQTIEVEVKYNVDFSAIIPEGCQDWITIAGTKGLSSTTYSVFISKNETFDYREGSITFKQKDGALSGTVSIRQEPGELPPAIAIDLQEETGRNEMIVLMENGAYFFFDQEEEVDRLYYNPLLSDEVSGGLMFIMNNRDSSFSVSMSGKQAFFNKVGESLYNAAIIQEDGTIKYWYGLSLEGLTNDQQKVNSTFKTKVSNEDKWHITKSVLLKFAYYSLFAISDYLSPGSTFAETTFLEAYKSDLLNLQEIIDKDTIRLIERWSFVESVIQLSGNIGFVQFLSQLNEMADEELAKVGQFKEVVKPELGDEWNIKLNPQVVTCQNANEQHVVQVSSKAMWKVDDSTVDHAWCNVEKVDDHIVVTVKENKMSSSYQTCYASIVQAVESNTYHISPVKLFIVQNNLKFSLSEKELVFGKNGGSKPVQVEYSDNIKSWRVTQWPNWCTIDQQDTWNYRATTFWVNVNASEVGHDPSTIVVTGYLEGGGYIDVNLYVRQDVSDDFELREKLIKFYYDTGGPTTWYHRDNWCSDKPLEEWYGLIKTETGWHIGLGQNGLSGHGDLSGCTEIEYINCCCWADNPLQSLNVSGCTRLTDLIADEYLLSLNASGCTSLRQYGNDWYPAKLQELDLSGCTSLEWLYIVGPLQSIDLSGCSTLRNVHLIGSNLQSLDVRDCISLEYLYCEKGTLQTIDMSGCSMLLGVQCWNNQLHSLNLTGCSALINLDCYGNNLESLDVSTCTSLKYMNCSSNHITQMVTTEDRLVDFNHDKLYNYQKEWDAASQSYVTKWTKNDYGWYYPGEPEKGYHGR